MSDILLSIIFITNIVLFGFFVLVLVGLIKTRKKTGNTITTGMILERGGLVAFWLWNIWLTIASTEPLIEYYYAEWRVITLFVRVVIGLFLVFSVIYTLIGD